MLIRLCGFGGNGDPDEVICGDYVKLWPATNTNKKFISLINSRDFGNRYQGEGTHWVEGISGKTY